MSQQKLDVQYPQVQNRKKDQSSYYEDCLGEGQERDVNLYLRKIAYRFLS